MKTNKSKNPNLPAPSLSDICRALAPSALLWQEVDRERLAVVEALVINSVRMFPSSALLADMAYLLQALKAAKAEMDRLRLLCRDQGIVTSLPSPGSAKKSNL